MAKHRSNNRTTTISVLWADKETFRKFACFKKKTKNGDMYESDTELFSKMLQFYRDGNKEMAAEGKSTYPSKTPSISQPSYVPLGTT